MLSVRLSVPCYKSRTERYSKLKIGRKDAHDTDDPCSDLGIKRSKVKVTRPLNAVTENQPYFRNGKAYELQTWYNALCSHPVWAGHIITTQT